MKLRFLIWSTLGWAVAICYGAPIYGDTGASSPINGRSSVEVQIGDCVVSAHNLFKVVTEDPPKDWPIVPLEVARNDEACRPRGKDFAEIGKAYEILLTRSIVPRVRFSLGSKSCSPGLVPRAFCPDGNPCVRGAELYAIEVRCETPLQMATLRRY